jgi:hypothetical protein
MRLAGQFLPKNGSNFVLFDRSTFSYKPVRVRTFTGFARRSQSVGAGKPKDVALPLGEFIGQPFEEAPWGFCWAPGTDGRTGSCAGRTSRDP